MVKNNIWKYLYNLGQELRRNKDFDYLQHKADQEVKDLNKCKFQPNASKNCLYKRNYSAYGMYERTMVWKNELFQK